MNCVFPGETIQVVFDSTSGRLIPCGSNGLVRRVRATEAISDASDASGACQLITSESNEEVDVGEIEVFGDGTAVTNEQRFWVIFRRDFNKNADIAAGSNPLDKTLKTRSDGRWVQMTQVATSSGVVHGTAEFDFTTTTVSVDVEVTFSNVPHVTAGQVVTALNYIGYEGDRDGECFVYYHGDGTGNEDGTFSLMGARCPA